ncbi:DUF6402 family protein [Enterobacter cloacae subsp. cloacae]|jgi:hypothetical protein|uniref:DUF6402 family protein n=1 Tax=Enterobacter cloacae TaxID=550 RepID=UPI0019800AFE|nr:DUF6402 family protein [Enterobacter cloacae]EMC0024152.1 hypothetical protein [Enterobacter cloacae]MBN4758163.1 hypothetical protein [Enterobacter cloacae]MCT2766475.1 hypothetical protein [Enterobacter cloacae]MCU6311814.1 hypothetical protein [Enterobacter cloacae]MDR1752468.1 DUF6402 family protein [Enterobacter cloacae]
MAVSSTTTTKEREQQEKKVSVEFFHIDMIPDAMRNMGWEMAPKLMEHWFSISPAYSFDKESKTALLKCDARNIPHSKISDNIVKMAWANQYPQVRDGIEKLKATWNTQNARKELRKHIDNMNISEGESAAIGFSDDVKELDAIAQVNYLIIGSKLDTINDWYGAIGNGNLKVCVRGYVSLLEGKYRVAIKSLGFYIKDTYDFLDDDKFWIDLPESLGVWGKERILNKAETISYMSSYGAGTFGLLVKMFSGFVPVFNSDFRKWQRKHNAGGDYIVFSDIMWVPPLEKDYLVTI